jgi:heptaprenyl diphosphate synthase
MLNLKSSPIPAQILRDLSKVETRLDEVMADCTSPLKEAAEATIEAGGKRLRPALVLTCGQAGVYDLERLMPLALSVELIHTATLVHDDILDRAATRRGIPTINARWGTKMAIASGNLLLGRAFILLTSYENPRIMKRMAETALSLSSGELMQQAQSDKRNLSVQSCLERMRNKTASLFSACAELGALVSGASEQDVLALRHYGLNLGMAFQIFDDVLDLTADEKRLGKPVGSDIRDGTVTLPMLYAMGELELEEKSELENILNKESPAEEEVAEGVRIVLATGAIDRAREEARSFVRKAFQAIVELSDTKLRRNLEAVGRFVVERKH